LDAAFDLGETVDFNVLGVFTDEGATIPAGNYDLTTNVFTSNATTVAPTLYVSVEDPTNSCTRVFPWTVDASDITPPVAICFSPTVVFNGESTLPLTIDELLNAANSSDDCGSFIAVGPLSVDIDCNDIGSIIPVTVTIEDEAGIQGTCTANVTVEGLACGWTDNGGIGCADDMNTSSFDYASQTYTLTANNCAPEFPYVEDRMAFVYQELCGDGEIIARVTDVNGVGYAGVTIRNDLTSGSPMVSLGTNHVNLVRKQVRVLPSYPAYPQQVLSFNRFWVRIVRTGHLFQAYASTDGVQWIPYINQYVFMDNDCLKVGLYAYSEKSGDAVTATFDNVMISDQTGQGTLSGINTEFASSPSSAITSDLNVYPNPASDVLNIDLGEVNWDEQIDIILFNSVGQQVRQRFDVQDAIEQIEVMDLESGVYNLMVKIGDTTQTKRVVITRP
jgi:regulation of enolase protein 1 (concanavalin A-like superfamily)